jgi:hypothetical protein
MPRGQTVNSDMYIQILKLCRTFQESLTSQKNDPEILPQHNQARPHKSFENQEAIKILGWTVLNVHHTVQILLLQISTSL